MVSSAGLLFFAFLVFLLALSASCALISSLLIFSMCADYKIVIEFNILCLILFLRYPELLEGRDLLVIPAEHEPVGGSCNYTVRGKNNHSQARSVAPPRFHS